MNITKENSDEKGVVRFQLRKLVESCGYTTSYFDYCTPIYRFFLCRPLSVFLGIFIGQIGEYDIGYDLKSVSLKGKSGTIINVAEKFEEYGFDVNLEIK